MDAGALVLLGDFNSPHFSDSLNGGLDMKADILTSFSFKCFRSDQPFYPPRIKNNFTVSSQLYRLIYACNFIVRQNSDIELLDPPSTISASALASLVANTR